MLSLSEGTVVVKDGVADCRGTDRDAVKGCAVLLDLGHALAPALGAAVEVRVDFGQVGRTVELPYQFFAENRHLVHSSVRVRDKGVVVHGAVAVENNTADIGVEPAEAGISGDGGSAIRETGCEPPCAERDGQTASYCYKESILELGGAWKVKPKVDAVTGAADIAIGEGDVAKVAAGGAGMGAVW